MPLNPPIDVLAFDLDLVTRLIVAALIGIVLGIDREWRGHAAGMRTHAIICFAAAAMTVSIIALYNQMQGERMDPLRLFEASGAFIGIIGAGLIVFSKGKLHNITTAANLWLTAVIGIACGAGQWPLVALATIISLSVITLLRVFEDKVDDRVLEEKTKDDA